MSIRVATAADWPTLGARSRSLDTGSDIRCDPTAPFPGPEHLESLATYLTIYCNDARTGWVGVLPDGTIKWIVTTAKGGQAATACREILAHVYAVHGACRGRVVNPTLRTFLGKAGCTVDGDWVTWIPAT